MSTRSVRLGFLCAAATLVACGRAPEPASPAGVAAPPSAGGAAVSLQIEPSDAIAVPGTGQGAVTAPANSPALPGGAPATAPGGVPATAPAAGAAHPGTPAGAPPADLPAPPTLDGFPAPKDGVEAARPALDAGSAGDAEKAAELGKDIVGGERLIGVESAPRKRDTGFQALGFDWGGTDVADEVYGYFGNSYASLYYDNYSGVIRGSLGGRSVYLEDGSNYLRGNIGWNGVNLVRRSGWFSATVSGYLGSHSVSLTLGNRSLRGYEGGTYFNTGTSWDGRTLSGSYGGYTVRVTNNSGTLNGYFGYKTVRVNSGWSTYSGWVGNKSVNLRSDMSSAAFLRRLPLLAADDWMIVSTMTELFDW
ncbi:MAG: hypothetical protein FJZ01_22515 [Candidatus Sericytochromatia bacterium]|nr:hypothetical protein [Candidatus Tanganyikabacteria bacterium]